MLIAPDINEVIFSLPAFTLPLIGVVAIKVHWYGVMYAIGFLGGWALGVYRTKKKEIGWNKIDVSDILFYSMIGIVIGGRLGYVLFYNPGFYLGNPGKILAFWDGGMSFHGGLLGVSLAMWWYARKSNRSFLAVADFLAPLTPLGLAAGRFGNFINQELWGRPTEMPWGMVFERAHIKAQQLGYGTDPGMVARHPTQLYEFALEGVALFILLWFYSAKPRATGSVLALSLIGYSVARFTVEFFRQPDAHIGYLAFGWLTMGQLLTIPMILVGIWLFWYANRFYTEKTVTHN